MGTRRKHVVDFASPGTMFSEMSMMDIDEWDPVRAAQMAKDIVERHGAVPYGFRFRTLLTADPVPDGEGGTLEVRPKTDRKSGWHYLEAEVHTYEDVVREGGDNDILLSNMRSNGWPLVAVSVRGYRSTQPFREGDCTVDVDGNVTARGDDPKFVEYRRRKIGEWDVVSPVMDE